MALGAGMMKVAHFSLVRTPKIRVPTGVCVVTIEVWNFLNRLAPEFIYKVWYTGGVISDIMIAISMSHIVVSFPSCEGLITDRPISCFDLRISVKGLEDLPARLFN